jgi:hypothetical protein
MIKQNWNISDEERNRILFLHESASKRQYLLPEQVKATEFAKEVGAELTPKGEIDVQEKSYPISFNFPSGYHSEKSVSPQGINIAEQVANAFTSLRKFLVKYKKPKFQKVVIESGESAVPNKDNEKPGSPRLSPGELAKMRSETIKSLLEKNFQTLVDEGLLVDIPQIEIKKPVIGVATVKDSEEALKEQFIKAIFTVRGLTLTEECSLDIEIKVRYDAVPSSDDKYHNCNDAEFTLLLNGVPVKVKGKNTTIFSLNNYPNANSVSQELVVDSETAKKILGVSENVDVAFRCESKNGCHESPLIMTVYSKGELVGGPNYMGTSKKRSDRMNTGDSRKVATMDKCGKIISVEKFMSNKDTEK